MQCRQYRSGNPVVCWPVDGGGEGPETPDGTPDGRLGGSARAEGHVGKLVPVDGVGRKTTTRSRFTARCGPDVERRNWRKLRGLGAVDTGITGNIEVKLTERNWRILIESRRQLITETGANYVMDKIKRCRRSPTHLTEPQMISCLIGGLADSDHRAVMKVNPPKTIVDFLTELRRMEKLVQVTGMDNLPASSFSGNKEVLQIVQYFFVKSGLVGLTI